MKTAMTTPLALAALRTFAIVMVDPPFQTPISTMTIGIRIVWPQR